MSEGLQSCCIAGFAQSGTPTGTIESINGTPTYVALPKGDYDKTKAILLLPDVFELKLENNKLLADSFAANGFATYIPAYLNGDALASDALNSGTFDLGAWIAKHGREVTMPLLQAVVDGLKSKGIKEFAATGYCFGGKYVMELVKEDAVKVAIFSHPSLLDVPTDLEAIRAHSVPMFWNYAESDFMFGPEKQAINDKIFADDKNYNAHVYPGTEHGFCVRGDLSNPVLKEAIEKSFENTVNFIKKHL